MLKCLLDDSVVRDRRTGIGPSTITTAHALVRTKRNDEDTFQDTHRAITTGLNRGRAPTLCDARSFRDRTLNDRLRANGYVTTDILFSCISCTLGSGNTVDEVH